MPIRTINPDRPPTIPSEYLLNFFNRNDLRWGIAQMGGRENVSYLLGGARVIPGKWKYAKNLKEITHLLPKMEQYYKDDLRILKRKRKELKMSEEQATPYNRPKAGTPQSNKDLLQEGRAGTDTMLESLQHSSGSASSTSTLMSLVLSASPDDSTKGKIHEFWSKEKAVKELYQYLENYRKHKQRPAVWMPQLAELSHEDYSKLFNACSRFKQLPCASVFVEYGQDKSIHSVAGLVPFREWRFFESQLQLFAELQHYLRTHHSGTEELFPEPLDVLMHGHKQLHELIRIHGGKTLLAQKLDMKFAWDQTFISDNDTAPADDWEDSLNPTSSPNWGTFSLDFAIQLLHFIRSQYLSLNPPLSSPLINMPSAKDLLNCKRGDLANHVMRYGGYESVARRLGLAYFHGKREQMEGRRYRGAKLLWKDRRNYGVLSSSGSIKERVRQRKRKGLAWDEEIVVEELHAYVETNLAKGSTVMPSFRQLDEDDRGDLARAISKFGGMKYMERKLMFLRAGLTSTDEQCEIDK